MESAASAERNNARLNESYLRKVVAPEAQTAEALRTASDQFLKVNQDHPLAMRAIESAFEGRDVPPEQAAAFEKFLDDPRAEATLAVFNRFKGFLREVDRAQLAAGSRGESYFPRTVQTAGDILKVLDKIPKQFHDQVLNMFEVSEQTGIPVDELQNDAVRSQLTPAQQAKVPLRGNFQMPRTSSGVSKSHTLPGKRLLQYLRSTVDMQTTMPLAREMAEWAQREFEHGNQGASEDLSTYNKNNVLKSTSEVNKSAYRLGVEALKKKADALDIKPGSSYVGAPESDFPGKKVEVVDAKPSGKGGAMQYRISVDGEIQPWDVARSRGDLVADMFAGETLSRTPVSDALGRWQTWVSRWLLSFRPTSAANAVFGNAGRFLSEFKPWETHGRAGMKAATDYMTGRITEKTHPELVREWRAANLLETGAKRIAESEGHGAGEAPRTGALAKLEDVSLAGVAAPDVAQKIATYQAMKSKIRAENPELPESRVKDKALLVTSISTDLSSYFARAYASGNPFYDAVMYLNKSSARTTGMILGQVREAVAKPTLANWAKPVVTGGLPIGLFAIAYAAAGKEKDFDLLREVKKLLPLGNTLAHISTISGAAGSPGIKQPLDFLFGGKKEKKK